MFGDICQRSLQLMSRALCRQLKVRRSLSQNVTEVKFRKQSQLEAVITTKLSKLRSINIVMVLHKSYVLYISILSLVSLKCKSVKVLVLSVTRQGTKALSLSAPPPPNKSLMFVPHSPFIPSVPPCPLPIPTLLALSSWLQL